LLCGRNFLSFGLVAVIAAAAFLGFSVDPDYIAYGSEDLSISLMVLFCVIYLRSPHPGSRSFAVLGLIATCLPFAKLQSVLLSLLLHGICLLKIAVLAKYGQVSYRILASYILGSLTPILLLVVPPFLVGEQAAVLDGYFFLGANYGGERTLRLFLALLPFIFIMIILSMIIFFGRCSKKSVRWDFLLLSICLWPVIFMTIWLPGRLFHHYRLYAFFGLPLAVVILQRALPLSNERLDCWLRWASPFVARGLVTGALAVLIFPARSDRIANRTLDQSFRKDDGAQARQLYDWAGVTSRDSLLMWGWMPELTAYAGLKPADRAAHSEYLIRPNPARDYLRGRLLRDYADRIPPALVVDTVRSGFFFANDPSFDPRSSALKSFPALHAVIQSDYEKLPGRVECPAVYLRRDLQAKLRGSEVSLTSSDRELVDGSMTERCGDWWAPSSVVNPVAVLNPVRTEPISELWILASRGGTDRNRGTTQVEVTFTDVTSHKETVASFLYDYPRWTVIQNPSTAPISEVSVTSVRYVGDGPALSEIKAFRTVPTASDR
jgi:hypothetical protein